MNTNASGEAADVECPGCGERIRSAARKCRFCGEFLDPKLKAERRKQRRKELANPRPRRLARAVAGVLGAIVFPLLAFGFNEGGMNEPLLPEWNDGSVWVWGKLLYTAPLQRWFYPLIATAMVAYGFYVGGRRNRWVHAGLVGGVVVSGLFSVLFIPVIPLSTVGIMMFGAGLLGFTPFVACITYSLAVWRYRNRGGERASLEAIAAAGPVWVPRALWAATGLGVTGGAWWTLVQLHSDLPTTPPPNCYLATVASRGAPRVVRSEFVLFSDGTRRPVTGQLRVFKVAELVLRAFAPRVHGPLRCVYDRVGPPLASRLSPWQATLAYVLLVPAQLLAQLALRLLLRHSDALVASTYRR